MPASKAQQKAVRKYMKENYDEIKVRVEKGRKATIQAHAEAQGQSVNAYINAAIDEKMAQEAAGSPTSPVDALGVRPPYPLKMENAFLRHLRAAQRVSTLYLRIN